MNTAPVTSDCNQTAAAVVIGSSDWSSFVYFIAQGEYIKIGKANDVQKRMTHLQSSTPIELQLIASIPTRQPLKLEAALHKHLKQYRIGGEWFELPPAVLRTTLQILWQNV